MQPQPPDIELLIPLVAIVGAFALPALVAVAFFAAQMWRISRETALKRDMVARGYTAQEIMQVVAARPGSQYQPVTDAPPSKPIKEVKPWFA